ncbi:hypothetical protein TBLA_0F00170 [Henningerozyma blattae CBS 6284]|uniref:NTF2 domain-containing protein n=1 Tax=Henningerozyma blattae (strain ATCC 34711 / CBS 6284 / DSM 70876 / NBRC 10599 / NRRL Y-10934 / UCD 77-7) TaxID=1071380 RepID=I2H5A9_HENB6|nr:hypothetical protein TBLA_0F00170 [Tetrapisispora blattae CBS 6284]CCH61561.1 hypothetical protein TBLA_0F00170 [Tetrapisispora blattae CBS 6284]
MTTTIQEIGYSFLQVYYQRMSKDPSKVSSLYSNTAEITHINYQLTSKHDGEILPTIKIIGKDNISSFFTRNNKKVCDLRVKIDSLDFQNTGVGHESILLLVTGEMFWTNTPAYRFCQTIILAPIQPNSLVYEATNDVIRFMPDNLGLYELSEIVEKNTSQSSEKAAIKSNTQSSEKIATKSNTQSSEKIATKSNTQSSEKIADSAVVSPITNNTTVSNAKTDSASKEKTESKNIKEKVTKPMEISTQPMEETNDTPKKDKVEEKPKNNTNVLHSSKSNTQKSNTKESTENKELKIVENHASETVQSPTNKSSEKNATKELSQVPTPSSSNIKPELQGESKSSDSTISSAPSSNSNSSLTSSGSTAPSEPQVITPPKMTWASKLSNGSTAGSGKGHSEFTRIEQTTTTNVPHPSKKVNERKTELPSRKENSSSRNGKKKAFSTVNREGFFPIYIRGTSGVDEDVLKGILENEFGTITRMTFSENFAVADFELQSSQTNAIERKSIKAGPIEVYLERKTVGKKFSPTGSINNSTSNQQRPHKKHYTKKRD